MVDFWVHAGTPALAAFLAGLVEGVEALTIVLAVGATRGWRAALTGCTAALVVLTTIVAVFGSALMRINLARLQLVVGGLLLLFGLRWLRKAILRAAAVIPLHDEGDAFEAATRRLAGAPKPAFLDMVGFAASFQITLLEGVEVVFIVLGFGGGSPQRLSAASIGALLAVALVALAGLAAHRPLTKIPENQLKFFVGIVLSAFGTFSVGEGAGLNWPDADIALVWLTGGYWLVGLVAVRLCRSIRHAGHSTVTGSSAG